MKVSSLSTGIVLALVLGVPAVGQEPERVGDTTATSEDAATSPAHDVTMLRADPDEVSVGSQPTLAPEKDGALAPDDLAALLPLQVGDHALVERSLDGDGLDRVEVARDAEKGLGVGAFLREFDKDLDDFSAAQAVPREPLPAAPDTPQPLLSLAAMRVAGVDGDQLVTLDARLAAWSAGDEGWPEGYAIEEYWVDGHRGVLESTGDDCWALEWAAGEVAFFFVACGTALTVDEVL